MPARTFQYSNRRIKLLIRPHTPQAPFLGATATRQSQRLSHSTMIETQGARLAAVGYRQNSSAEVSSYVGVPTSSSLSPFAVRMVKSAPLATYITRFRLTLEGDLRVTCFVSFTCPISYCSLFEPGSTMVSCFIPRGGSMTTCCERISLLRELV
jgi:hypothetical protein